MKLDSFSDGICKVRYVKISPIKARLVSSQIRNRSCNEAINILTFLPHRACPIILKALKSSISNYRQIFGYSESELIVKEVRIDTAPFLKRLCPHAQGRAFPIKKHYSHITSLV